MAQPLTPEQQALLDAFMEHLTPLTTEIRSRIQRLESERGATGKMGQLDQMIVQLKHQRRMLETQQLFSMWADNIAGEDSEALYALLDEINNMQNSPERTQKIKEAHAIYQRMSTSAPPMINLPTPIPRPSNAVIGGLAGAAVGGLGAALLGLTASLTGVGLMVVAGLIVGIGISSITSNLSPRNEPA